MVRRVTPAEYQRLVREELRRRQDAVNRYNRAASAYNRALQQREQRIVDSVNAYNRKVVEHNRAVARQRSQVIDNINRAVRAHNAQLQDNERKRSAILQQLANRNVAPRFTAVHTSAVTLDHAYESLERRLTGEVNEGTDNSLLALSSQENINCLEALNALTCTEPPEDVVTADELGNTEIDSELRQLSGDLDQRWRGALFSLNPLNPDAARHFCTSSREIISKMLELQAPDEAVIAQSPDCDRTREGRPTRRSKIEFITKRRGIDSPELDNFLESDIQNVVDLFGIFNSATHGEAGKYRIDQLIAIRKRVEGGILFLSKLAPH